MDIIKKSTCWLVIYLPAVFSTYRYYSNVFPYGTVIRCLTACEALRSKIGNFFIPGDTMLSAYHGHGGTRAPHRKWNVECMDGEAMVGIHDWADDFEKLQMVWCKFMFPNKPPTQGLYPYYPSCHTRDFGILNQKFCYVAQNHSRTVNTFITALWDSEFQFWLYRPGGGPGSAVLFFNGDDVQPYKCCKTPTGYYIDYASCYFQPTHDSNWEYYDSVSHIIVYCAQGFIMTGISKRANPWTTEVHAEYIQCCRLGFGPSVSFPPPVTVSGSYSGRSSYAASQPASMPYIPAGYQSQYRMLPNTMARSNTTRTKRSLPTADDEQDFNESFNVRFAGKGIPATLKTGPSQSSRTFHGISGPQSA